MKITKIGSAAFWAAFTTFALANWLVAASGLIGRGYPWFLTAPALFLLAAFMGLVAVACLRFRELVGSQRSSREASPT